MFDVNDCLLFCGQGVFQLSGFFQHEIGEFGRFFSE